LGALVLDKKKRAWPDEQDFFSKKMAKPVKNKFG
jgi:hypothetical protein